MMGQIQQETDKAFGKDPPVQLCPDSVPKFVENTRNGWSEPTCLREREALQSDLKPVRFHDWQSGPRSQRRK